MDGVLDDLMSEEKREEHTNVDPAVDIVANHCAIFLPAFHGMVRYTGEGNNPDGGPAGGDQDEEV